MVIQMNVKQCQSNVLWFANEIMSCSAIELKCSQLASYLFFKKFNGECESNVLWFAKEIHYYIWSRVWMNLLP